MNKSAIKNFAVTARKKLMEAVLQKAHKLGNIYSEKPEACPGVWRMNKLHLEQRDKLSKKMTVHGFDQVIEEAASVWFNRIIAIRFMEVNDFLPIGMRLLSSIKKGKTVPDAVSEVMTIADELGLDLKVVHSLQKEHNTEELFKYILIMQCHKLAELMPMMFDMNKDFAELLLPDNLLLGDSVIHDLVTMIKEEDWKGNVEIIGWLYQHYIAEKKDQVFADLKKNKKITKENIPAATQLFTPKWIVQYMVENSLGKLWLEAHPDPELQKQWEYYLEQAEQSQEINEKLESIKNTDLNPEEIKLLDPCMGSGHILVYAFDVLFQIYQQAGYLEPDIPACILKHNLYGLDIDDNAARLACFALIMKARSYNPQFFNGEIILNIISIQESNDLPIEAIDYLLSMRPSDGLLKKDLYYLRDVFYDAKEYGSIIQVNPINISKIEEMLHSAETKHGDDLFAIQNQLMLKEKLPLIINQMKVMSQKYTITITNPPYMGFKGMNNALFHYLKKYFPNSKTDLFAVFLERLIHFTDENGFSACIAPHSWMFLSRYTKLRTKILQEQTITSMIHLGPKAFEEIGGEVVQTAAFVRRNTRMAALGAPYIRLIKYENPALKQREFFNERNKYISSQDIYFDLPNAPVAYWAGENVRKIFNHHKKLNEIATPNTGLQTSNNNRFIRFWYEVDKNKIGFHIKNNAESIESKKKWFPYNKGGSYRKWFGNQLYVVNWEDNGDEIRKYNQYLNATRSSTIGIGSVDYYFREGISWSKIGTDAFSVRYSPKGFIFDVGGSSLFVNGQEIYLLLALLNSKTTVYFLSILNPTMNFQVGNISSIPIPNWNQHINEIEGLSRENIMISKRDWDWYETSWGFSRHPFVSYNCKSIQMAHEKWLIHKMEQMMKLKKNEEKLNKLFIDMYGLQNELNHYAADSDITLEKENIGNDCKSFMSYAIGCLFGRYSIHNDGDVLSGGKFTNSNSALFYPEEDNCLPITDAEYFEKDLISRFIEFVRVSFGKETLEENLDFLAVGLGGKTDETSRERLRRYFVKEFYDDHLQVYQKRPIYWLFDSGKNAGFKALIYMHRYDANTLVNIQNCLHAHIEKYKTEISRLNKLLESNSNVNLQEKSKVKRKKEILQKKLSECQQYALVIAEAVNQKIVIDLDDGVKVNYEKFQHVEAAQGEDGKSLKIYLLAKI